MFKIDEQTVLLVSFDIFYNSLCNQVTLAITRFWSSLGGSRSTNIWCAWASLWGFIEFPMADIVLYRSGLISTCCLHVPHVRSSVTRLGSQKLLCDTGTAFIPKTCKVGGVHWKLVCSQRCLSTTSASLELPIWSSTASQPCVLIMRLAWSLEKQDHWFSVELFIFHCACKCCWSQVVTDLATLASSR